jgi:EmrB/QacA subfamily drug resistance transporter
MADHDDHFPTGDALNGQSGAGDAGGGDGRARGQAGAQAVAPPQLDRRQLILALSGVLLCILVAALDQTIVGTALPRIIGELNGFSLYSWVYTSYLLTATLVLPIAGKLSDQFGRKPILMVGLVVFVVGSMLSGASQTMLALVIFRGLQGFGAGALQAGAFASIGDLFSPAERGRWQGVIAASFGIATIFGPSLGGWITDNPGWRWVFYVNLPVGILAFITLLVGFPSRPGRGSARNLDYLGVAAIVAAVVLLQVGLTWAQGAYPWGSVQVIGMLAAACVFFVAFVLIERFVAQEPLLPLDLFRSQIFSAAFVASLFIGPLLLGLSAYLPLFVQGVLGQSATSSGAVITPLSAASIVTNIAGGQLISRTGKYQRIALVGLVLMNVGMLLVLGMGANTDNGSLVRNMIITGLGFGFVLPVYTLSVQNASPYNRLGVVTSAVQFSRSIGSTIGLTVLGTILTNVYNPAFANAQTPAVKRALALAARSGHPIPTDPTVLVDPNIQATLRAAFARFPGGNQAYNDLFSAVKVGLLDGLHATFLALVITAILAFVATLFLKEIPLRQSNAPAGAGQAAAGQGQAAAAPALGGH